MNETPPAEADVTCAVTLTTFPDGFTSMLVTDDPKAVPTEIGDEGFDAPLDAPKTGVTVTEYLIR